MNKLDKITVYLSYLGGVIIVIQSLWIGVSVFLRKLGYPDPYVTEVTALMLLPLAFLGMSYSLKVNGYPEVTLLNEKLPTKIAKFFNKVKYLVIFLIGIFFTLTLYKAFTLAYVSGASSEILEIPRTYVAFPTLASMIFFNIYSLYKLYLEFKD
ncbi:TRAP transporter small permease [Arcobacter sp. YIC-80]|uniref:TRAP transporter small permease n=1 Tax=unclassified Arcobacter TaxID=2593671 RepID=UPI00385046B4